MRHKRRVWHTRFSKSFSYHLPYDTVEMCRRQIQEASLEKLAVLIKICGFLLQSKIYVFCAVKELSLRVGAGAISLE